MRSRLVKAIITALVAGSIMLPAGRAIAEPADSSSRATVHLQAGDTGTLVGRLQDRLTWLGYEIDRTERRTSSFGPTTRLSVLAFQEKFFIATDGIVRSRTWRILQAKAGALDTLPEACRADGRIICIDKNQKLLRYLVNGRIRLTIDARFGFSGADTREGTFDVYWKNRDQWSSAFDAPMPYSMFFSRGQAIHFSPYFKKDGYYGASHGCVNIRDREAARWMFDTTPVGTPVIIYSGKE